MQGRGNARFSCTPSPKPRSTTNKNRLAARTGKKLGCGNDARWNPWKSPTPTFPPLPPHLEIPQQTRDSHIPTATTTTGYRGLDQHQTKINTKANTNNKTKVVYTDNLTHPRLVVVARSATCRGPACSACSGAGYLWNESVIPIPLSAYRHDLRQEPDEAIPQVRICAGGAEQSASLPRPTTFQ